MNCAILTVKMPTVGTLIVMLISFKFAQSKDYDIHISQQPGSWNEAKKWCSQKYGKLAVIKTEKEVEQFKEYVSSIAGKFTFYHRLKAFLPAQHKAGDNVPRCFPTRVQSVVRTSHHRFYNGRDRYVDGSTPTQASLLFWMRCFTIITIYLLIYCRQTFKRSIQSNKKQLAQTTPKMNGAQFKNAKQ